MLRRLLSNRFIRVLLPFTVAALIFFPALLPFVLGISLGGYLSLAGVRGLSDVARRAWKTVKSNRKFFRSDDAVSEDNGEMLSESSVKRSARIADISDPVARALVSHLNKMGLVVNTDWEYSKKVLSGLDDRYEKMKNNPDKIKGFVWGGVIHINPNLISSETFVHEYTHIWAEALRQKNPEEWKHIVEMMKEDERLWNEVKEEYVHLESDDDIADEVLAQFSGRRGYERLSQYCKDGESPERAFKGVLRALEKFWKNVAELFDIHYESRDDLADRILSDFLRGANPEKFIKRSKQSERKTSFSVDEIETEENNQQYRNNGMVEEGNSQRYDSSKVNLGKAVNQLIASRQFNPIQLDMFPDNNESDMSIVSHRDLDTDEVFIQNHSDEERMSLRYQEGEAYDEYMKRNHIPVSDRDRLLYMHDKYTDVQWNVIDSIFKAGFTKENASEVGKRIATLSFVTSKQEAFDILVLNKVISPETVLPYYDGVTEHFRSVNNELSPLLKQFFDLKEKHPNALLLFRTGDFYESYEEDAEKASKILGITLTKSTKQKGPDGNAVKMAGFPYHALDTYLPKLIRAGERVAICDQLEAPKQTVKRGITEMVVPQSNLRMMIVGPSSFINQNYHIIEDGLFVYVDARNGFGLSAELVNQVAGVYYGSPSERDGRLMYGFPTRDDAANFVHQIGILNERYTDSLRDGLIEKMKAAGIDVNTDWEEGERVLAQENGRVSMMGSTTRKRQQEIGEYLNEFDLNENEKKIVEAFGGNTDGDIVTLKDSKGKDRHIVFIQGNDNGVGIKHSVFTHYGTRRGVYVAEDILKIPQVIEFGERKQNGNRISYSAYISDKKFTLITQKTSEGKEEFVNYFSNKKIEKQREFKAPQALSGDTELTARAANVLNSVAKVQHNFETTKENSENLQKNDGSGYSREDSQDVRYMLVPDSQSPIFISNALLALNKIKQEKATPEQWLKMLEKNGGIKAGEDRWTGLTEWLRSKNDIKEEQLKLILNSNPHDDSIGFEHTWIRQKEDIKTFEESFGEDYDIHESQTPDYTADMISSALKSEKITVYSSHPIEDGAFVTPSKMEAQNYAGGGQVYSKEINLKDVAWIDPMQGQYAPVKGPVLTKSEIAAYIKENMIEVEEVSYVEDGGEIMKEDVQTSVEFSDFVSSLTEFDENDNAYIDIKKFNQLSKENDDVYQGFRVDYWGEGLEVDDPLAATRFLGIVKEREVNETRLKYTTDGLTNNREIALVVPSIDGWAQDDEIHFGDAGDGRAVAWVRFGETRKPYNVAVTKHVESLQEPWRNANGHMVYLPENASGRERNFSAIVYGKVRTGEMKYVVMIDNRQISGHDTLEDALTAMNEYYKNNPYNEKHYEKVLVIDEIQSKRHQEGREVGYKAISQQGLVVEKYDNVRGVWHIKDSQNARYLFDITTTDAHSELEALSVAAERRYRIENGIGGIDIPGVPDAPFEKNWQELCMKRMLRYAAENGYDRVAWTTGEQQANRYDLSKMINFISYNKDSHKLLAGTLVEGSIDYNEYNIDETVVPEELPKFIGKDLAPKVLEKGIIQGDDLRVGGEGMKAFYDDILVRFTDKYTKKWGAKTEDVELPEIGETMHSVPVTEQMRSDVMQGQPMFFRNGEHQAYGFVHDGTIYIDPRIATAETPIHEYTHLWAEVLRQRNPQEWQNIVQMMKDTSEIWNYVKQNYPHLRTDDQIADEALAQFSGRRGYQKLQEFVNGQDDKSIFDKMEEVLEKFWSNVAEFFGIHYENKEDVADRILYDLLKEVNPLDYKIQDMEGLYESREPQIESKNFKFWFGDWRNPSVHGEVSKVVDDAGYPLVVEHGTHNRFTEFDSSHIGETSGDQGLYGKGFYFGLTAPAWLDDGKEDYHVMRVYLNLRNPKELVSGIKTDIYDYISENFDSPALRGLILSENGKELSVGDYIDAVRDVDNMIKEQPSYIDDIIEEDEELQVYHPKDRLHVWREHEIFVRTGFIIPGSLPYVIGEMIGSEKFSDALQKDGYDGVIVTHYFDDHDYKEFVAFSSDQIRLAEDYELVDAVSENIVGESTEQSSIVSYMNSTALQREVDLLSRQGGKIIVGYENPATAEYVFVGESAKILSPYVDFFGTLHYSDDVTRSTEFHVPVKETDKFESMTKSLVEKGYFFAIVGKERVEKLLRLSAVDVETSISESVPKVRSAVQLSLFDDAAFVAEPVAETQVRDDGLSGISLHTLSEGEHCYVERRYTETGAFSFVGGEHIETDADVAYIFKKLEDKSVENTFVCMVKDGEPTVIHLSIGDPVACMAPLENALLAYSELKPDKIWFIHNHPSGNLHVSRQDFACQQRMVELFPAAVQPAIIINTVSGKFITFDYDVAYEKKDMPSLGEGEKRDIKVYSFDRNVFSKDWSPGSSFSMTSAWDVAKYVSSHRLGEHNKLSLLVINNQRDLTGNVFLPWTDVEDSLTREGVALISRYVHQMGGVGCILYGADKAMVESQSKCLASLSEKLKEYNVRLFDVMSISKDLDYYSCLEIGALDPGIVNEEGRWVRDESGEKKDENVKVSEKPVRSRSLTVADREAGGALVDHLRSMGVSVYTDNHENRRVLKTALKDQSEAGKVRHFKTVQGESYGFAYKGEIHLDVRKIDAELPLHEYAHLWCEALRRINPDNWNGVVQMMKQDAETWNFVKAGYPELSDDSALAEEVIAHYSGKRGAAKLQAELERMTPKDADYGSRWGNIFQNISKAIQDFWRHVGDSLNIRYESKEDLADQILNDFASQVNPVRKVEKWLSERDKEYAAAVESGDTDKARNLFWDALTENVGNGITPFMSVDGYRGKLQALCHDVKSEEPSVRFEALSTAVDLMSPLVPENAVLVPAPSHLGRATNMLTLAQLLSQKTGAPVVDILKSNPRESQYFAKKTSGKPLSAEELGIYRVGSLPEGKLPVVIDNVVHSGNTAEACVKALGKGVVLSLASAASQDRHVASLKRLDPVVYDRQGNLIPLSERFELKNKWLGIPMKYKPLDDMYVQDALSGKVQGLNGYSYEDIELIVEDHVNKVLAEQFPDEDVYIKEVTVIGSRIRGEAHEGSDLDILLEYGGEDIREDTLFNVLHEAPLEIEGIPVDINPINEHYSLDTASWLERDARWREADFQKNNTNQNDTIMKENEVSQQLQTIMSIDQVQEKAVKLFGNNFVFDFWNETEPGTKIDQIDLGGMPDTITIDKLVIKDGKLSLYSDDLAGDIDLQALDAVDISKVDASLGDIKEYLNAHQKVEIPALNPIVENLLKQVRSGEAGVNRDNADGRYVLTVFDKDRSLGYERGFKEVTVGEDLKEEVFISIDNSNAVTASKVPAFVRDELLDYAKGRIQLASNEQELVALIGKGQTFTLSEPATINVDEFVAKDVIDSITVADDGSIALNGRRIDESGASASYSLEGRDEYDLNDIDIVLDAVKWDLNGKQVQNTKLSPEANHDTAEKPYRISIGTDDRPGGVEGEFHVQFVKEINAVSFKEIQSLAEELGGSARIMNNQEWADFYDESSAVKFADKVVAMNAERIVAGRENAGNERRDQLRTLLGDVIGIHGLSIDIKPTDIGNHTVANFLMNNNGTILFDGQVDGSPVMNRILDIDHLSIASAQFLMNSINNAKSMQKPLLPPLTDEQWKKMSELGYPYAPGNAKAGESASIPEMVYWRVAAGMISSYEAVRAFANTGYTVGEDPARTTEILSELNDKYGKLDKYLQPISEQRPVREGDNSTLEDILNKDDKFRYMLLSRMQSDVKYFLGNGNRHEPDLWAGNAKDHIIIMDALMRSLPEQPQWLSTEQLIGYADQMGVGEVFRGPADVADSLGQEVQEEAAVKEENREETNEVSEVVFFRCAGGFVVLGDDADTLSEKLSDTSVEVGMKGDGSDTAEKFCYLSQGSFYAMFSQDVDLNMRMAGKDLINQHSATLNSLALYISEKGRNEEKVSEPAAKESAAVASPAAQPSGRSKWDNIDYTQYVVPEGVTISNARITRIPPSETQKYVRYSLSADVGDNHYEKIMYSNDLKAYYEKDSAGKRTNRVTLDQLVVKYFGKRFSQGGVAAVRESADAEKKATAEKSRQNAKELERLDDRLRKERQKDASEDKKVQSPKPLQSVVQSVLLMSAIDHAFHGERLINEDFRRAPVVINAAKGELSPFNSLMLSLQSEYNGYKSNAYITYNGAMEAGYHVNSGERSITLDRSVGLNYVNRYDGNDIVSAEEYKALSPEEQEMYKVNSETEKLHLFNIDQTSMPESNSALYASMTEERSIPKTRLETYDYIKERCSDDMVFVKDNDNYYTYGDDAKKMVSLIGPDVKGLETVSEGGKDVSVVSYTSEQLTENLGKFSSDVKLNIVDVGDNLLFLSEAEKSQIGDEMDALLSGLSYNDPSIEQEVLVLPHYNAVCDVLSVSCNSKEPNAYKEAIVSLASANYRAVSDYLGSEKRLNRTSGMLPFYSIEYNGLVGELSACYMMLHHGVPYRFSDNFSLKEDFWKRELTENHGLVEKLSDDVNTTVAAFRSLINKEQLDYRPWRSENRAEKLSGMQYSITETLSLIVLSGSGNARVAVVRNNANDNVAVILPRGASAGASNEPEGLEKKSIALALRKEGYENISFYNAGGYFGLNVSNDFFRDKTVTLSEFADGKLETVRTLDFSRELDRTHLPEIEQVALVRDENNDRILYVKPTSQQAFAVYPEKSDIDSFCQGVNSSNFDDVRESLGRKYMSFVKRHPDQVVSLVPPVLKNIDVSRISDVVIARDKNNSDRTNIYVTIDGKRVEEGKEVPRYLIERFLLSEDKDTFKNRMASFLYSEELGEELKESAAGLSEEGHAQFLGAHRESADDTGVLSENKAVETPEDKEMSQKGRSYS